MKVDDAVLDAARQAIVANCQGSFGVGGMLIKTDGTVIQMLHNSVYKSGQLLDPTAHGERQLVNWYFENKQILSLPEPEDIILVTTLDPCAMCTGATLSAGFKRVVVAAGDASAGINYDGTTQFLTLKGTSMYEKIVKMYSYPRVLGNSCFSREGSGADILISPFDSTDISETTQALCSSLFQASIDGVEANMKSDFNPSELTDLEIMAPYTSVYKALRAAFGDNFLAYRGPAGNPGVEFADVIYGRNPNFRGISFFDNFGNLIFTQEANDIPTQTAFMLATQKYAKVRSELINGIDDPRRYLCHPKYGYFLLTSCPDVNAQTLMDLGAFGSTVEDADRNPLMYILEPEKQPAIDSLISKMPPLYSQSLKIRVAQASDSDMVAKVKGYIS